MTQCYTHLSQFQNQCSRSVLPLQSVLAPSTFHLQILHEHTQYRCSQQPFTPNLMPPPTLRRHLKQPPPTTSGPCCGCEERGSSASKSTDMFLTSKYSSPMYLPSQTQDPYSGNHSENKCQGENETSVSNFTTSFSSKLAQDLLGVQGTTKHSCSEKT